MPKRLTQAQREALDQLESALTTGADVGLFDRLAANYIHPGMVRIVAKAVIKAQGELNANHK